jgi:5-(carboxyamino)imidazole ribonucleotide synthase
MNKEMKPQVTPGSTIGIFGDGQLGRMLAMAASSLGYKTHSFGPQHDSPASQVTTVHTIAAYDDSEALNLFAQHVDVVTIEFENLPVESLERLAQVVPVMPGPKVLTICQDRIQEKSFLEDLAIPVAPWCSVHNSESAIAAFAALGKRTAILKSARLGYDGKSQTTLHPEDDAGAAYLALGQVPAVLEERIDFACEISVIVVRGQEGQMVCYPPGKNQHKNGILDVCLVPAEISADLAAKAEDLAKKIAESLSLVGLLCVEMFVTKKGQLLVNELAPRPHNSGHWTLDGCVTSQFEQTIRAVCGLPLGAVACFGKAKMQNLIGDDILSWRKILDDANAKLHLYGKSEAKPGRKMGHVTWITPK